MELAIAYIFLSVVVGILGRNTFIGFWGNFIFALFLSPVIPLIYIILSNAASPKREMPIDKGDESNAGYR